MKPQARILSMSFAHMLNDGAANYLPGVLPVLLARLDAPKSQAGLLVGVMLIGQSAQPLIGWFNDRIGGKILPLIGLYGTSAAGVLIGLSGYYGFYWLMILALIALGILNSCFHPPSLSAVRYLTKERHGLSISTFLVGGEIGRGLWPFLAGLLVGNLNLGYLWILGIPALIFLPLFLTAYPTLPAARNKNLHINWRKHLHINAALPRIMLFTIATRLLVFLMVTYLPLWYVENGGSVAKGAALVTVFYSVGILGNGAGGYFADKIGFRNIGIIASCAIIIFMALFLIASGLWIWITLALLGIAQFAHLPIGVALAQEAIPDNPAAGAGIGMGLCNAISAALVIFLGLLAGIVGYQGMIYIAAISTIPVLAVSFLLPELNKKQTPHA